MKDYYAILGVSRSATEGEIKRAYRRLAVAYHPDKNPAPGAAQIFQEINEAYEVIGDREKRRTYDYRVQNPFAEIFVQPHDPRPRHRDPAYKNRRPNPNYRSEKQVVRELLAKHQKKTHAYLWFAVTFCSFLALDLFLPMTKTTGTVLSVAEVAPRDNHTKRGCISLLTEDLANKIVVVYPADEKFFAKEDTVVLRVTRILTISRRIETKASFVPVPGNIYGIFIFLPAAVTISSILGLIYRKKIETCFNLALTSLLCFLFMTVMMMTT